MFVLPSPPPDPDSARHLSLPNMDYIMITRRSRRNSANSLYSQTSSHHKMPVHEMVVQVSETTGKGCEATDKCLDVAD